MSVVASEPVLPAVESLRASLQGFVPELASEAEASLREALKATKKSRVRYVCSCGRSEMVTVEVQDAVASTQALKVAVELAEGRSGTADVQSSAVVVREVGPVELLAEVQALRAQVAELTSKEA